MIGLRLENLNPFYVDGIREENGSFGRYRQGGSKYEIIKQRGTSGDGRNYDDE